MGWESLNPILTMMNISVIERVTPSTHNGAVDSQVKFNPRNNLFKD